MIIHVGKLNSVVVHQVDSYRLPRLRLRLREPRRSRSLSRRPLSLSLRSRSRSLRPRSRSRERLELSQKTHLSKSIYQKASIKYRARCLETKRVRRTTIVLYTWGYSLLFPLGDFWSAVPRTCHEQPSSPGKACVKNVHCASDWKIYFVFFYTNHIIWIWYLNELREQYLCPSNLVLFALEVGAESFGTICAWEEISADFTQNQFLLIIWNKWPWELLFDCNALWLECVHLHYKKKFNVCPRNKWNKTNWSFCSAARFPKWVSFTWLITLYASSTLPSSPSSRALAVRAIIWRALRQTRDMQLDSRGQFVEYM